MSANAWGDTPTSADRDRLLAVIAPMGTVAVAYSGGVDSAVVAKAAHVALGDRAVAVTAVSPSLAAGEWEQAAKLAELIGIRHRRIETNEFQNPDYLRNAPDRCYHCKSELYNQLTALRAELDADVVLSGANLDDQGDYRPGLIAAAERGIRHPLQEAGLGKDQVRALARAWDLPAWDKPASPCLSSRIAYGEEVTLERVTRVDQAESWLRARGFTPVRVRHHQGDLARVEVAAEALPKLVAPELRSELVAAFRGFGFRFVTFDLEGFRSGSLNTLVPLERLTAGIGIGTRKGPG